MLAPTCPIERVTLWVEYLYLIMWFQPKEGVTKSGARECGPLTLRPSLLSSKPPVYPVC